MDSAAIAEIESGRAGLRLPQRLSGSLPVVASAGVVFVASFCAALLFLRLSFAENGPAILYPPYAILAGALILAPVRRWWIYMLATAAGSLLAHSMEEPALFALLSETANYTKGVVAGAGMRRYGAGRLDGLRSIIVFLLFAVLLGPVSAGFIGAGLAVTLNGAGNYWLVWRGWVLSNAVTGLTLLPIIVVVFGNRKAWPQLQARRVFEAVLLFAAIVATSIYIFVISDVQPNHFDLPALLYAPLPLLLWAALRFGVVGNCVAILTVAVLAIVGALGGHGPFVTRSASESLLQLQFFLISASLPLMLLTAVLEERRNNERALRESQAALKASYAQVQSLVGRLIAAQEAERTFIARELHDDVCQRLAGLVLKLDQLKLQLATPAHLMAEVMRTQNAAVQITETVRNISHELHPGALRYIGVVDSLRDHCNRFAAQHEIPVTLSADRNVGEIPGDVALCLYRVTQEALRNVAAHAKAKGVRVRLHRSDQSLNLTISDDGDGFDPEMALRSGGLGLVSMDERVRLVGGTVTVQSGAQNGTALFVRVPLADN